MFGLSFIHDTVHFLWPLFSQPAITRQPFIQTRTNYLVAAYMPHRDLPHQSFTPFRILGRIYPPSRIELPSLANDTSQPIYLYIPPHSLTHRGSPL